MFGKLIDWGFVDLDVSAGEGFTSCDMNELCYVGDASSVVVQFRLFNSSGVSAIYLYSATTPDSEAMIELDSQTSSIGDVVTLTASVHNGDKLGCYLRWKMGDGSTAYTANGQITVLTRG
jgi:hypothetical protein